MVVEGVPTTKAAYLLGEKYQVELPITNIMYKILYEDIPGPSFAGIDVRRRLRLKPSSRG